MVMKRIVATLLLIMGCLLVGMSGLGLAAQTKNAVSDNALFPYEIDGKYGYINSHGQVVIEPKFEKASYFSEGRAAVSVNGKYGYIDLYGKLTIKPDFDFAVAFSEGAARIVKDGKTGFIDKDGNFIIQPVFEFADAFHDGLASVSPSGYINKQGVRVLEKSHAVGRFSKGLAPAGEGNNYGFINKEGVFQISPQFERADRFSEGLAAVKKGGKWGYIDVKGNMIIEPQFDKALWFSYGLANVSKDGKYGFIDKSGATIIDFKFSKHSNFFNGFAYIQERNQYIDKRGHIIAEQDTQCGVTVVKDASGKVTWPRNIQQVCQKQKREQAEAARREREDAPRRRHNAMCESNHSICVSNCEAAASRQDVRYWQCKNDCDRALSRCTQ